MRPGNNARRPRGRPNRKQHGPPRAHSYDSHGPDVRIRGNAPQIYDKYVTLARDATASGDRIAAEGYYQFAEHYFRIMNDSTDPRRPAQQPPRGDQQRPVSEPVPPPAEQEQPQVEWPQQLDSAVGKPTGTIAEPSDSASAEPATADDEMPRRQPKSRPRGRRRAANGAKDPDAKRATKADGHADENAGPADADGEEPNPAEESGKSESVTPSN